MAYLSFEQISVPGATVQTASVLTIPAKATSAEIQAAPEGAICYTMDGTNPGSSRGMVLPAAGIPKEFNIMDIRNIRFCKEAAGGATRLLIHYLAGRDI